MVEVEGYRWRWQRKEGGGRRSKEEGQNGGGWERRMEANSKFKFGSPPKSASGMR